MQAIILAGGKGTRLRPYTASFPKPLVPVGQKPIMEIVIRQLRNAGFGKIVISTGHLAELIEAYFGNGKKLGVEVSYVREEKPLNTAGALSIIDGLEEDFLVMNGDILTTLDYAKMFRYHLENKASATIGVHQRIHKVDYGVIKIGKNSSLEDYVEKPQMDFLVSMGINILNKHAVSYIKKGEPLGMPDLMLRLKGKGEKVICFKEKCEWLDIGRPDDYELAQNLVEKNPERYFHD
ncbi:NTP transferase domain-containing protein [Candidatus Micrarchaeota archaeon]|nr:NTP transferase domain-containing protein [Candidatus Micrarchaeota archaeon]